MRASDALSRVPVTPTFLVTPPEQGEDLDNIALTVLPIAHEVLRPHIAPHLLSPTFGDEDQSPERAKALARLKSVNALSVRAYQVIELSRSLRTRRKERCISRWDRTSTRAGGAAPALPGQGDRPGRPGPPAHICRGPGADPDFYGARAARHPETATSRWRPRRSPLWVHAEGRPLRACSASSA